jgi:hypothetical protein
LQTVDQRVRLGRLNPASTVTLSSRVLATCPLM